MALDRRGFEGQEDMAANAQALRKRLAFPKDLHGWVEQRERQHEEPGLWSRAIPKDRRLHANEQHLGRLGQGV